MTLAIEDPEEEDLVSELEITDAMREEGSASVIEYEEGWQVLEHPANIHHATVYTIAEIEAENRRVRKQNAKTITENERRRGEPRPCRFSLSPINIDVPTTIIDSWIAAAKIRVPPSVEIKILSDVEIEPELVAISAKIHGSKIGLLENGSLLWRDSISVALDRSNRLITLKRPRQNE